MGLNTTTFFFEIVNFLALVWVLQRLVYRPLRRSLDDRRAAADERDAKAAAALEQARALEREYAEKREALNELRDEIVREAGEQAAEERARIVQTAHEDAAAERARVARVLDAEREAAAAWVREMAIEVGTEVAGKLLVQLAPAEVDGALLDRLLEKLGTSLATEYSGAPPGEVELTFAKTPADGQVARVRDALGRVFGASPRFVLREDPSLLAGAVCRVGDRVYDASVAGQLDVFRAEVRSFVESEASGG